MDDLCELVQEVDILAQRIATLALLRDRNNRSSLTVRVMYLPCMHLLQRASPDEHLSRTRKYKTVIIQGVITPMKKKGNDTSKVFYIKKRRNNIQVGMQVQVDVGLYGPAVDLGGGSAHVSVGL